MFRQSAFPIHFSLTENEQPLLPTGKPKITFGYSQMSFMGKSCPQSKSTDKKYGRKEEANYVTEAKSLKIN